MTVPADRPDAELLAAHVAGDPSAFGELVARHRDRAWALALRTCRDTNLAEDAVQEAFLAAHRRAASFRGDAAVTTWLHRIVVNASIDQLRRLRPSDDLDTLGDHAGALAAPQDEHERAITRLDVHDALARLPEAQRAALVLVDMHGVPVAEAATSLGVAPGTVKSRCFRGRAALAQLLGVGGDRPGSDGPPRAPGTHAVARTSDPRGPGPGTGRARPERRQA